MACATWSQVPCYFAGDLLQAAAFTVKAMPTANLTATASSNINTTVTATATADTAASASSVDLKQTANPTAADSSSSNTTTVTTDTDTTTTCSDVDTATIYQMSGLPFVDSWPSLFVGPSGSCSGLHIDAFGSNFWMALLQGHKKWTLFPR
jgi:hypothetical protein